ncbi:ATP-binding protein [Defluviitalea phaphyphila]|uniref:ATP-binding protein n=1 Tax=Defluviitalea phaphyphila TaxID=1473580 RepID=UPI000AC88950|nr:ATP-binding protein [Defluviitalea phaphyphila]
MHRLIIYRNLLEDDVIKKVQNFLKHLKKYEGKNNYKLQDEYSYIASKLLQFGVEKNINSSLWKEYIYDLMLQDENIFSLFCEKEKNININKNIIIALKRDLAIIKEYLNIDWNEIAYKIGLEPVPFLNSKENDIDIDEMINKLADYYYKNGCGIMGKYKAFRWENGLKGIENPDPIRLKDLIGYEEQKKILIENTESFLNGKKANNVLLFGDRGTGKSSSVKALLNEYAHKGLRLIELAKHQLVDFNKVISLIKNRSQYFIIFMDDLSFEEFEIEYKYMKALIEGGVEKKPDNVLIYATSNRRHLIKETWKDRDETQGEVHISDSVQEKISLADRFGISITFTSPNQEEYLKIVEELAKNYNLNIPREELRRKALQWEMYYNGRSGRSAKQFIDYMLGR